NARFAIPEKVTDGIEAWFKTAGDAKLGTTGYHSKNDPDPSMNAIGLYARRFLSPGRTVGDPFMALAAKTVPSEIGDAEVTGCTYQWYYSMLSLFEYEAPAGDSFRSV